MARPWHRYGLRAVRAVAWLAAVLLGAAVPAVAQATLPVVGYLLLDASATGESSGIAREMLRALGQIEGRTYTAEWHFAGGDNSRFPLLARQLLERRPAVIVSSCGPALRAIRDLNATVPVIAGCADPRNFHGEVASLNRPGGRTTGFMFLAPEAAAKRLHLMKEMLPRLSRVGILHHRNDDWSTYWREMEPAARQLGLALSKWPVERAEDLAEAFAGAVRQRVEAMVVFPDATTLGARARIAALARQHRMATIFEMRIWVQEGGLMSYGLNWADGWVDRLVATYVDKILRGTPPGELPIQEPTRLELVINLGTARALGIAVPAALRDRADQVID